MSASVAGAERAAPAEPSDLALRLGGQTGSEALQQAPGACTQRVSYYAVTDVTPLGFPAQAIADALTDRTYQLVDLGADAAGGPVELRVELTAPAAFLDRSPPENPSCPDALLVPIRLDIVAGDQFLLQQATLDVYAAAVDRFAARALIPGADLPAALADIALGSSVVVFLEYLDGGAQLWFYGSDGDPPSELLGRLVPVPESRQ